ncbi:MAG: CHASE2 domain-containing protein [Duncaniella sp.]|nr:CHASE2 domain-containing protein [Duncaniella sp.]
MRSELYSKVLKVVSARRFVVAAMIAAMLLAVDYFCNNLTFPIFDTSSRLLVHSYLYDHDKGEASDSDLVAVNVAYDKTLADAYNEFDEQIGYIPVTDREKLARFLKIASQADYRYIFIDVSFPYDISTPADSSLFAQINSMNNVVVSVHRDDMSQDDEEEVEKFAARNPDLSADKMAYADYRLIKGNAFSKYEFLQDGHESVALRMYRDLDGGTIKEGLVGYTDNGRPCYNMQFITLPKRILLSEKMDGEIRYPYLTGHFFARHTDEELAGMLNGKIIVIGDYENDMHDTLIGPVPGPMLSYYAYRSLADGRHLVNWWLQLFMFCLYTALGYWTLSATSVSEARWSNRRGRTLATVMVMYFMGTGVILGAVDLVIYFLFADSYTIIIPTIVFTLLSARRRMRYMAIIVKRRLTGARKAKSETLPITQS